MGKNKYRARNDILHLIEEGYQKLASSISKKLEENTNSNHVSSIAPKKTPNKFVDTDFPSYQSAKKQHKLHVISTSLLKNVVTPTKKKKYQILGDTTITYNDGTIRPTLSRVAICDKYNRGNKVITM